MWLPMETTFRYVVVHESNNYATTLIFIIEHPYQRSNTEITFNVLLRELSTRVSSIWEDIGLCLGLSTGSLDIIRNDNPSDSKRCFREMIKLWFKRVDPSPSWAAIIEAVDVLGYEVLAKNLRDKFL